MSENPLLQQHELPPFTRIKPEHVREAVDTLLADNRAAIERLLAEPGEPTWETIFMPLEELQDALSRAWAPVAHMNAVVNTDELREAHNSCLPRISDYHTELGQNRVLYEAYRRFTETKEYAVLDAARRKVIENALRDFRLTGIDLPERERDRVAAITRRLTELASEFSDNVLDATEGWIRQVDHVAELAGLPDTALAAAREAATAREIEGWVLTLEVPSYLPVMTYCENRELRREMYEAYNTRASDQGPQAGRFDNGPIITEMLALRSELADLLGFGNFAERSLATKMAGSTEEVMAFLRQLADRAVPAARREYEETVEFARERFAVTDFAAWDYNFFMEKLREERFAISDEELRPYFPVPTVLGGLFEVAKRLYGIEIGPAPGWETWHEDVRCYQVIRGGEPIAGLYMDLYVRGKKRGGAWMADYAVRRRRADGSLQLPIAFVTCNFSAPVGGDPSLLTHREVVTLFHEFGHSLHHMLTRIEVADVSGIYGVAWDAVELPSQFHENWCWQPEALEFISGHYQTGERLPDELLARMIEAKNFHSAIAMVRQLEFGLFDFQLHMTYDGGDYEWVRGLIDEVRARTAIIPVPEFNRFQNGFGHIFGGGYEAGYYSYLWAEVLSADAFDRFAREGIFNRQTGEQFLETVLEQGGSRDAMELFVAFRGREPEVDALLRQEGIVA